MNTMEISWLAGLLEGEGSFVCTKKGNMTQLGIHLGMSDADVVHKAAKLLNTSVTGPTALFNSNGTQIKDRYRLSLTRSSDTAGWMMTLYPLMGDRRQCKIKHCLSKWLAYKQQKFPLQYSLCCKNGHPRTEENTRHYVDKRCGTPRYDCRVCANARRNRSRLKHK